MDGRGARPGEIVPARDASVPDYFDEGAFASSSVKFAVEDLFPGAEIEFAFGDGDDDFAAHDLAFEMGVGIVFAGAVVMVLRGWLVRREFFQPDFVVVMEAGLVVVYENRCGDVHGVDQAQPLLHPALAHQPGDRPGDVHKSAPARHFKPQLFGKRFHNAPWYASKPPVLATLKSATRGQAETRNRREGVVKWEKTLMAQIYTDLLAF